MGCAHAPARALRKPRTVPNISGSSSRKASWPLSVAISTKLTLAATAFSACATSLLSAVGNSQSGEGDQAETRVGRAKGVREMAAAFLRQIEIIHRPGDVEIGIGVEAIDEA